VDDSLNAVTPLKLARASGERGARHHPPSAGHPCTQLVLNDVFDEVTAVVAATPIVAYEAGDSRIGGASHLHVRVFGIHPRVDSAHVKEIATDDASDPVPDSVYSISIT
jgi:hypothetical protein